MHRIEGTLHSARHISAPGFAKPGRSRGAKAKGRAYEKAVGRFALPKAVAGQWWEAEDATGKFFCQTDFVLRWRDVLVVVEAKYTWTMDGHRQAQELYAPIVELAMKRRTVGLVVCKRLVPGAPKVCERVDDAIGQALAGAALPVWQWLGP